MNIDKSRFIICRAAAGSGKTYTLVRQYLQLAFSAKEEDLHNRFTRILAITFANKAANEMKERILRELDNMADKGIQCDMGKDISESMKLDDNTLKRYAEIVRQSILHNYSDFAVCTIDSFMHRLVRTFAHDLNLPMNFEVNIKNDELIQQAVDELMAMAGTDGQEELTRVMCEFAEKRMEDGKSYMIEGELTELAKELFKEQTPEYLKDLSHLDFVQFSKIYSEMRKLNSNYEKELKALGQNGLTEISNAGLDLGDFFQGAKGAGGFFRKIAEGNHAEASRYALDYLAGDKLGGSKCTNEKKAVLESIKPKLQTIYNSIVELQNSKGIDYNTRKLLMKNIYSLALINKLGELVGQLSKENEVVHISEFNKKIAEVVQDEPTPFIYERIGSRYYNYLIDEFQDTSKMQWQNLVPLIENGVGGGHTSLVVGDGKQAIYRFRQGDVRQFVNLPHVDNPVHGGLLEQPGVSIVEKLDRNFRTNGNIVDFNNRFFEWVIPNRFSNNAELQKIYIGNGEPPELEQKSTKNGGYVQLGFWDTEGDNGILWNEMLDDIHHLTATLGYHYRDMAILARHKDTLAQISSFLTSNGIPVLSNESFLLSQSKVVMLLKNVLRYLLDSTDKVAAALVLQYLVMLGKIKRIHHEAFIQKDASIDLDKILETEGIRLNSNRLRQLGLYDCCEEALRNLQVDGIETAYTATLLNKVAGYANNHRQDLGELIEWLDKWVGEFSTSTADDLDAVKLMTIHKAKGLESPVVLYPIVSKKGKTNALWVHIPEEKGMLLPASLIHPTQNDHTIFDDLYKEENNMSDMDRINVLYVALTRPKEKLMIYCQLPQKKSKKEEDAKTDFASLLYDYCQQRDDRQEIRDHVVAFGENSPYIEQEKRNNGSTNIETNTIAFPNWTDRIAIAEQSAKIFGTMDETSIKRGNQIHELLSLMNDYRDKENAIETFVLRAHLDDKDKEEITTLINSIMETDQVRKFFSPEHLCKNECSLAWNSQILRPDRVVFTPTETWVIDFKTGAPKIDHRIQVSRYCEAIQAMGYPSVKGYLMYIGTAQCQVIACE